MRNHLFRFPLALIVMLFANACFSQQIDSMMGVYADRLTVEKIHIHFDKTIYNKGETVWYKIYILQGNDTATASKNVYLEWYDEDGKLISNVVAPILISTTQGSFDIPEDFNGELLQVKAYTKWMLNEDPAFNYHRELVVNTNRVKTTMPTIFKTTVATFPEGGFLIQGLQSRVAFKATNQFGNPVFIKGVLVDDKNNVLDSLQVMHDGMGSFYLEPLAGQAYQLNWIDQFGATGNTPIPVTKKAGATISISASKKLARFQVSRTEVVPENFKKLNLLVHMNRVGLYQVSINTAEKNNIISNVPINELPTGLLQFTLFTSDWIPIAERVIFINNHLQEFNVKVSAPIINFDKRAKNALDLYVPDTLFTNMSIAITDANINPIDQHTIFSDLFLSSEIKGKIHQPGYYLSSEEDSVAANLDLVMLTNAWRRFDWDKIKSGVPPIINYPAETVYMKIRGKVLGMKHNNTTQVMNMVVARKDSSKQMIFVPIATDGSFEHPMFFFDTAKLFYNFNNNKSLTEKAQLQIDNGLLKMPQKNIPSSSPSFFGNDSLAKQKMNALLIERDLLKKKMAEATLQEVVVRSKIKTKEQVLSEKYSSGFFSRGEAGTFDLTDSKMIFARNILEYLQSRVAGLDIVQDRVSWRGDIPTFFLNEMAVDLSTLMGVDMNNIAMIKVFRPPFMFATGGGRGGAIAIYTKKGGDNIIEPNIKGLENEVLAGYTKFREFYSPNYEQPSENFSSPDSRTTLYWNPYLISNNTQQKMRIEFFNNDFTKKFNVVLEGINAAGKMTRVVRTIDADTKVE